MQSWGWNKATVTVTALEKAMQLRTTLGLMTASSKCIWEEEY